MIRKVKPYRLLVVEDNTSNFVLLKQHLKALSRPLKKPSMLKIWLPFLLFSTAAISTLLCLTLPSALEVYIFTLTANL